MTLFEVRCPNCERLAAEVGDGTYARVRCARCKADYEYQVTDGRGAAVLVELRPWRN